MASDLRFLPVTDDALWAAARMVRQRVFVEEQACPPDEEWDAWDDWAGSGAHHVVMQVDGETAGTARWHPVVHEGAAAAKLERFAVLPAFRGRGLGQALVAHVAADAARAGYARQVLYAQAHLERFYEAHGFRRCGETFWEVGILHVPMCRDAGVPGSASPAPAA